jgi:GDPmannose 4,6-dehydratase
MITRHAAQIALGLDTPIPFSNPSSKRDWGHAKDFVEAMWLMVQQDKPDDYVIATGEQHSNREFTGMVFEHHNIPVEWQGTGADETCIRTDTGAVVAFIEPKLYRPTDVTDLHGDPQKAKTVLGWEPKISFEELVKEMAEADLARARKNLGV